MMVERAVLSVLEPDPGYPVAVFQLEDAHARGLVSITLHRFGNLKGNGMIVDIDSNGF